MMDTWVFPVWQICRMRQRTNKTFSYQLQCRRRFDGPPYEKLNADFFGRIDQGLALVYFPCMIGACNALVIIVGDLGRFDHQTSVTVGDSALLTPNTHSQPVRARLIDSLSHRSAVTTSTPWAASFLAASEEASRVTARGVKVLSACSASTTDDPESS